MRTSDGKETLVQARESKKHSGSIGLDYRDNGKLECEEKLFFNHNESFGIFHQRVGYICMSLHIFAKT